MVSVLVAKEMMSNEDVLEEVKTVRRELEGKRDSRKGVMTEPRMDILVRRLTRGERENRRWERV